MEKPKLPSIQLMLQGMGAEDKTTIPPTSEHHHQTNTMGGNSGVVGGGHKRHASDLMTTPQPHSPPSMTLYPHPEMTMGGLPGHMQKLSISNNQQPPVAATPIEPTIFHHHHHHELAPPNSLRPTAQGYHFQSPTSMLLQQHRSPRNMHSRSFSDYSHPYPTPLYSATSTTKTPSPMNENNNRSTSNNNNANNNNNTSHSHTLNNTSSNTMSRPQYLQTPGYHRRAISTNTLDLILQPTLQRPMDYHHHHPSGPPPPQLYASSSTTTSTSATHITPTSPVMSDGEMSGHGYNGGGADNESHHSDSSDKVTTTPQPRKESGSNKYHCPYCDKGFSRPSSLRIHTYSHTGEKPFVCPEPGCSRKFSVQSNMRRHLRVHRLGRTTKRITTNTIPPSSSNHSMDSSSATSTTATTTTMEQRRMTSTKPIAVKPASWVQPQEQHHHHPSLHLHHHPHHLSAFNLPSLTHDDH
ncbi:hypothetical protein BDA99DRAFT_496979 [Phascolomyces articulosus]|uniref:C2H2-type domain-containing protein n=2 Tax=Lichtheimiaceae TaxID=499202 RepID=A0AAD5KA73_9FUNG|nr:hypothetical protein BDA99DRAFT_496979 [Phascolomyces articulosus]